jgi:two-component system sporulation sensor kinase A
MLGQFIWEAIANITKSEMLCLLGSIMEEMDPRTLQHHFGELDRWFEFSFHPDQNGIAVFFHDINELKEAEGKYAGTNQQLESMFENSPDTIAFFNTSMVCTRINKAFEQLYGFTSEEAVGRKTLIVPESHRLESNHLFSIVMKGNQISGYETKRQSKSGKLFDVSLTISPVLDASGRACGLAVAGRDISDRKRMERVLRQSEEKHRIISENTSDMIILLDSIFSIRYASPSHEAILGMKPEQLIGLKPFHLLPKEDAEKADEWLHSMVRERTASRFEFNLQLSCGTTLFLESYGKPVIEPDGTVDTLVIITRDISERKHTEELLRQSDKLSVAGQLAAGIAHEIRNPLTALKGFTQFMKSSNKKDLYFDIMMSEFNRIEYIISELLLLAKPQASKYELKSIIPILEGTVSLLGSQANMNKVEIMAAAIEPDLPPVWCEENQLKQVFINILKNAIEAMPRGGRVHVAAERIDPVSIRIRFQDEGTGIPKDLVARLGEPFYTTKEGGSGLGLMVTHKIVSEHRGAITFDSVVEQGTTVDITLPFG